MKKIIGSIAVILVILSVLILSNEVKPINTDYSKETTVVAVLLNGEMYDGGWGQSHVEALENISEELKLKILWYPNSADSQTHMGIIEEAILKGATAIFGTSILYQDTFYIASKQYPEQQFFVGGGIGEAHNFSTYFGKMYQMRYLSGIIAGMKTETNNIGYVAANNYCEVNRGVNGFTLGVRSVNPDAVVNVILTGKWANYDKEKQAAEILIDEYGVDVITLHQDTLAVNHVAEERGIYHIGYHYDQSNQFTSKYLTSAVWDWENYYKTVIYRCIQKSYDAGEVWEGFELGIVKLAPLSEEVDEETTVIVEEAQRRLFEDNWDVFYGPVYDNKGNLRVGEGENISDKTLLNNINWHVEGVFVVEQKEL